MRGASTMSHAAGGVLSATAADGSLPSDRFSASAPLPIHLLSHYSRNATLSTWLFSNDGQHSQPPLPSTALEGTANSVGVRVLHGVRRAYVDSSVTGEGRSPLPPPPPPSRPPVPSYSSSSSSASSSSSPSSLSPYGAGAESSVTSLVQSVVEAVQSSSSSSQPPSASASPSLSSPSSSASSTALAAYHPPSSSPPSTAVLPFDLSSRSRALSLSYSSQSSAPTWHAPWRLLRVMAGHQGWVRSVAVDPSNDFFVSASNDRTLKCWDLATGELRLTLTGHVSAVRAVCISKRHPYLFSASEDKTVRCWDLEQNCAIRNYHGHLSGVYCLALHPALDLLVSGGRDSTCRLWDMRSKAEVAVLSGHTNTVASLLSQSVHPQVISGSHDATIRLWDIRKASAAAILTHHKKSVRALVQHPTEFSFASAASDHLKVWKCPEGQFLRNLTGHDSIVNALALNREDVLVSGGDDGSLCFWDWRSGYRFDRQMTVAQSGSLDSERGIFDAQFDVTGSRLLTAEADKTVKVWAEREDATPLTHPITMKQAKRKRY